MAVLPSGDWIIQQCGGIVHIFDRETGEEEIVSFNPRDVAATTVAQREIENGNLSKEDKVFAHFWSGYFYAHAKMGVLNELAEMVGPEAARQIESFIEDPSTGTRRQRPA